MKALLIAGGSGGHLIPALALALRLKGKADCVILSTRRRVDRILRRDSELQWIAVDLRRLTPLRQWLSPAYAWVQLAALARIWSAVRQVKPDIIVGFGGYLSALGVAVGRLSGLKVLLHEQNLLPGRANRLFAPWANAVAVSFPETKRHLSPRSRVEVTGNPLLYEQRSVSFQEARAHFGFDEKRPLLLVIGGSQGSSSINQLTLKMWQELPPSERSRFQVLHLAGPDAGQVKLAYQRLGMTARAEGFLSQMDLAYTAATVAISRAGATTLAELVAFHLPALLIPYPHAGAHQRANAVWLELTGGAVVLEEEGLTSERLRKELEGLAEDPNRLARMRQALAVQSNGSAAGRLTALVESLVR